MATTTFVCKFEYYGALDKRKDVPQQGAGITDNRLMLSQAKITDHKL